MIAIVDIINVIYTTGDTRTVQAQLVADTVADLPTPSGIAGYLLTIGSICDVIQDSTRYMMMSSGQWVQQLRDVSADVYTRAQIDAMVQQLAAAQTAQAAEIGVIANAGAKNIMQITRYAPGQSATSNGRTFTVQADGGVLITGTATGSAYADFYLAGAWTDPTVQLDLSDADYILSISSSPVLETAAIYVRALDRRDGTSAATASASLAAPQRTFSFPITVILITVQPAAQIPTDGIIVYPMIRRAEIQDATFQPYAPTNRQLYEMI